MRLYPIEDLAPIDNLVTRLLFHRVGLVTRVYPCKVTFRSEKSVRSEDLKKLLYDVKHAYGEAARSVEFAPSSILYSRYLEWTSFDVVSTRNFQKGEIISGLIGFISSVPKRCVIEGYNDFSVFSSEKRGYQNIMLGPTSFLNSSCRPNCEYVHIEEGVGIRVIGKNGISAGESLTVCYGPHYFGDYNVHCQCPHIEKHGRKSHCDLDQGNILENRRHGRKALVPSDVQSCRRKRKKAKYHSTSVESPNLTDQTADCNVRLRSPEPSTSQQDSVEPSGRLKMEKRFQRHGYQHNVIRIKGLKNRQIRPGLPISAKKPRLPLLDYSFSSSSSSSESSTDSSEHGSFSSESDSTDSFSILTDIDYTSPAEPTADLSHEADDELSLDLNQPIDVSFDIPRPIGSSTPRPIGEEVQEDPSSPPGYFFSTESNLFYRNLTFESNETLFPGSRVTVQNFHKLLVQQAKQFNLSDKCMESWVSFIQNVAPEDHRVPSYSMVNSLYNKALERCRFLVDDHGKVCLLPFEEEIKAIVVTSSEYFFKNTISLDKFKYTSQIVDSGCVTLGLTFNADGVPLCSSTGLGMWPVWLKFDDLPVKMASAKNNIVLAALWVGKSKKPKWLPIFKHIRLTLENDLRDIYYRIADQVYPVKFKLSKLIADLPAKASLLKMKQFNGDFGCSVCYAKGEHVDGRHLYKYEPFEARSAAEYLEDLQVVLTTKEEFKGLLGVSPLFKLIIIPIDAPIDLMHQVYYGAGKQLIIVIITRISAADLRVINSALAQLEVPSEVNRKPRSLNDIPVFKIHEYRTLLLYLLPVLLPERIDDALSQNFLKLSIAIKILSTTRYLPSRRAEAASLLEQFCEEVESLYRTIEKGEFKYYFCTYNVHSLRHLADQSSVFGPLTKTSAMAFESANRFLRDALSGTLNHLDVIVKRYLRNKVEPGTFKKLIKKVEKDFQNVVVPEEWRRKLADYRIVFKFNGHEEFGEIVCFAEEEQRLYVLVNLLISAPFLRIDRSKSFFAELHRTKRLVKVSVGNILCKFILFDVEGKLYGAKLCEDYEHA